VISQPQDHFADACLHVEMAADLSPDVEQHQTPYKPLPVTDRHGPSERCSRCSPTTARKNLAQNQ
jgi:hypothetical protein